MVGKDAFDALSTHPETVFYDVTRLLATDFDPNQPNPSWAFKATRNADGKIVVRGASGIATYPIIVFGLIVRSTLLYIQTYQNSEVAALGIRFLAGSTINDADLKELSKYVGVQLVLV
uniref:Glyceraldehyde-3-phosphate dehydrogenase n=1 Tax=Panagrellus redivivus TaxID=6233 RepID=A0A7E4VBE7_PANRE